MNLITSEAQNGAVQRYKKILPQILGKFTKSEDLQHLKDEWLREKILATSCYWERTPVVRSLTFFYCRNLKTQSGGRSSFFSYYFKIRSATEIDRSMLPNSNIQNIEFSILQSLFTIIEFLEVHHRLHAFFATRYRTIYLNFVQDVISGREIGEKDEN